MFSSRSFRISGFKFRSLIHLELILCRMIDIVLISFFCLWTSSFPRKKCWRYFLFSSRFLQSSLFYQILDGYNYEHSCLGAFYSIRLHVLCGASTILFYYYSSIILLEIYNANLCSIFLVFILDNFCYLCMYVCVFSDSTKFWDISFFYFWMLYKYSKCIFKCKNSRGPVKEWHHPDSSLS